MRIHVFILALTLLARAKLSAAVPVGVDYAATRRGLRTWWKKPKEPAAAAPPPFRVNFAAGLKKQPKPAPGGPNAAPAKFGAASPPTDMGQTSIPFHYEPWKNGRPAGLKLPSGKTAEPTGTPNLRVPQKSPPRYPRPSGHGRKRK